MRVAARVALGVLAIPTIAGGGMLTAMVLIYFGYFGEERYVPELTDIGGWGSITGMCALAVYAAGALRAPMPARIAAGVGIAVGGLLVSRTLATVVSMAADRGGPQGNLEDGTFGFLWLLAGLFFAWTALRGRWPTRGETGPDPTGSGPVLESR